MSTTFAEGFRSFDRKDGQPDFILGEILITPEDLLNWAKKNPELTSDYKGKTQVKFQIKKSKEGKVYVELNTWKPDGKKKTEVPEENLPF